MQFEKKSVRLGDIRPSGQNPREDFGDIGALARSIEATGGEPLNPPVVVADGNVYRIVDGERRYRALSSLYGEDREVSALVADTMDEANELVAMLATDDKRQLTEAERARGVQQMLVLGIDEQRIERASRATAGQIRAARRLRGSIEGRQVTLEQLEAASAFDDEKDVEAVLAVERRQRAVAALAVDDAVNAAVRHHHGRVQRLAAGRLDAAGQGADVAEVLARVLPARADVAQAHGLLLELHVIPPSSTSRSVRSPRWRRRRR